MELLWYEYAIIILAGLLAGCINTLAGNGSAITLSILTEYLGLPANIANGTNRIGVLTQGVAGTIGFYRNGKLDLKKGQTTIIATCLGAFIGVAVAVQISNGAFVIIYRYLMVAVLLILLIRPKRWISIAQDDHRPISPWIQWPLYLVLGFYGGFIQMGMGVFYLASLVLVSRYTLVKGNALKTFVVGLYTIVVLAIFHYRGLVRWDMGLILAIGQALGGFLTAEFASRYKYANEVAYGLLLCIVLVALWSLFLAG
ncbi:MAG: sulfite exporter TauE/SafE family protein [Saprospiraceae bacterium]|nr:sulfite exporter TauE/SafE family protein [Saprospiraceae bacterium]